MGRHRTEACGNGHPWTEESTYIKSNNARVCKVCVNIRLKHRYRHDEAYREYQKVYSRDRYHRIRKLKQCQSL